MAKEKKGNRRRSGRGGQNKSKTPTFYEIEESKKRHQKQERADFRRKLARFGAGAILLLIAAHFIWGYAQTRHAKVVCDVCGTPIERGVTVNLKSFNLTPPWEAAISAAADKATTTIFHKSAPSPTPTPDDEADGNIHFFLCGDCAGDLINYLSNGGE